MEQLYEDFPCRSQQIDIFAGFFSQVPICKTPEAFFVYGGHAGGKTSIISNFFSLISSNVNYALVNCIECYTSKLLLESIVSQLFKDSITRTCSNVLMLIDYLKLFYQLSGQDKHIVIVLDNCEYLDELGDEYMRSMSRLRELSSIPTLSVILITHLLPDKFNADMSTSVPVYFPQYSKDNLMKILMKDKPEEYSDEFYSNYLKAALSTFYSVTRDLSEISQMVKSNFVKYCEPLEKIASAKDNTMALWRNIVPHLRASLLSALSGTAPLSEKAALESQGSLATSEAKGLVTLDLPYYSKYFLIAAYLASYNSTKQDKRLFLKNHGKRRKRKNDDKKVSKDSIALQLLGPRIFPLDRLLAIFYFIVADHPNLTASLLSQITTLVELRLLMKMADGVLDRPSYKCMASFACVNSVARTVGFNISKYLLT